MMLNALEPMKLDKSTGEDSLGINMWIYSRHEIAEPLSILFTKLVRNEAGYDCEVGHSDDGVWTEELPEPGSWLDLRCWLLNKCQEVTSPGEWRPISLLPSVWRIFDKVLSELMRPCLDHLPPCDLGGRAGKQAAEAIQVVRQLVEACDDNFKPEVDAFEDSLCIGKFDCKKAFDSVAHPVMWEAMQHAGLPAWLCAATLRHHRGGCVTFLMLT